MDTRLKNVCGVSLDLDGFKADWRHCDLVSNYIARAASFNRPDSFSYSNLLSTVVNELLEIVFRRHGPGETLRLDILENPPETVVELAFPVDEATRDLLMEIIRMIEEEDPQSLYLAELTREGANPSYIGFYELAANYKAKITIQDHGEGLVKLTMAVNLNGEW